MTNREVNNLKMNMAWIMLGLAEILRSVSGLTWLTIVFFGLFAINLVMAIAAHNKELES
jgi:hypothetical protein